MFVRILFFTLFPYTTLFRSRDVARGHRPAHREGPGTDGDAPGARLPSAVHGRRVLPHARADRKSTRLNSSHVAISYAVLCLKKKINKDKDKMDCSANNILAC